MGKLLGVMVALTIGSAPSMPQQISSDAQPPHKLATHHLPNAVQVHPKVISGGLPADDAAFAELRKLGVRTVISVDGATPDVGLAKQHGLRYVHLPHGYDGVPKNRVRELAKAVRDFAGPVYLHCHHGKHRSPAAAGVACVAAGLISPAEGQATLELAGTSPNYRGLYESVREAQPLEAALLNELDVEFRETVAVPPMAEAMVAIEQTHDHLKQIAAAGWRAPAAHPDLEPAHEALLLREHFTELLRTGEVQQEPEAFGRLLKDSAEAAGELETRLRSWESTAPPATFNRLAHRISNRCQECHQQFRDVPLSEK